jgi:hypothetical protein
MTIEITRYEASQCDVWNAVVAASRNGNFLHNRSYMDYHADRFEDFSLIISRENKPIAVFPCSKNGDYLCSHGGLTYGGVLSTEVLCANEMLDVFNGIRAFCMERKFAGVEYKLVPYIFHRYPCQEDLYALWRFGAKLIRRDASSVIALQEEYKFSKGRKWSIAKARKAGIVIKKTEGISEFYELLVNALKKFDVRPTHSLAELLLLKERFPENIVLYMALYGEEYVAGALLFDFGQCVHTQYLANSPLGREVGALDMLLGELIQSEYRERNYFSFGISTEKKGTELNAGLIAQKEGFGARTIVHDFYLWEFKYEVMGEA